MKIVFQLIHVFDCIHISYFLGDIDTALEIDRNDIREVFFLEYESGFGLEKVI